MDALPMHHNKDKSVRFAILANPASGRMTADEKRSLLAGAGRILNAGIYGLDTSSPEEFAECARELASRYDVLVAAGGDGTLSDVVNAIDAERTTVAYLPLGSGNALRHALGYKGPLTEIAERIKKGKVRYYDLIDCDNRRRAFMASVGFEGAVLQVRDDYIARGAGGFNAYLRASVRAYCRDYKRVTLQMAVDGSRFSVSNLLTLIVSKQPYYGYGLKVIPQARFDDGLLHTLCISEGLLGCLMGGVSSFAGGNRQGRYLACRELAVTAERKVWLQIDGNRAWKAEAFRFTVLPRALKIRC